MIRSLNYPGRSCIVLDIDTQNCFFSNGGRAPVHNKQAVLANVRRVIAWVQLRHVYVVSTKQVPICYCHFQEESVSGLEKIGWTLLNKRIEFHAADCTDLSAEILERYDQVIFCKRCADPFEEPRVDRLLTELEADEFVLIGSLAEGAIKATALGLLHRGKKVTVLVDAIGTYNVKAERLAVRTMRAKGANLSDTKAFLSSSAARMMRRQSYDSLHSWSRSM